jgi:hypothetical protein
MSTLEPKQKVARLTHFAPAYTLSNILKSGEYIDEAFELFFGWLDSYAFSRTALELNKFISYATFDVIGEIVFSHKFGFLDKGEDIGNAVRNSTMLIASVTIAGFFEWINVALLANPIMTWLSIMPMGHIFETTNPALAGREDSPSAHFDLVSYWLKQHTQYPDKLSMRDINTQALAAIGTGSDTISCVIQSFIYHMLRHPNSWQRAQAEIDEATQRGLCQGKVVSYSDAQQLRCVKFPQVIVSD